ncbi:CDP-alcohol phosphatidyltransferase family protein [Akkermansiaceae bacterium]|nr:CDP-alcohol phosphatidyltransferase family protein [Akkermansiaceae bacterium]
MEKLMSEKDYTPERRPLAARNLGISAAATRWLAAMGVSPNSISVASFFVSLGSGAALWASNGSDHPILLLLGACLLLLLRGACNMLDGMVAVSTGIASRSGELFNEVPDRLSDAVILIGAGYAAGGMPQLGYIAAIAAVFTAYVRVQGCSLGAPADFGGPMSKVHRMILVAAAALCTAFSPTSWRLPIAGIPDAGFFGLALVLIIAGCAVTSVRRLRNCARILNQKT